MASYIAKLTHEIVVDIWFETHNITKEIVEKELSKKLKKYGYTDIKIDYLRYKLVDFNEYKFKFDIKFSDDMIEKYPELFL